MANNPHAQTYKGSTTFSGPIKAGSRWLDVPNYDRTTVPGTIAVKDLPNAGFVVCSQSCAVEQKAAAQTATDINLPSGSMILSIQYIVTAAFTGTKKDLIMYLDPGVPDEWRVLTPSDGTGGGLPVLDAVGVYNVTPNVGDTRHVEAWRNISDDREADHVEGRSIDVRQDSTNDGDGRCIVTINYVPGMDLPNA